MKAVFSIALFLVITMVLYSCLYEKGGPRPTSNNTTGTNTTNNNTSGNNTTGALLDSLPCGKIATTNAQNKVCFNTAILPIFLANCATSGCHDSKTAAEGYDLSSYDKIIKKGITVGNAKNSKLYKVMIDTGKDRMPPAPNVPLSSAQLELIASWINEGAKNIQCETTTSSNTTQAISYSKHLVPILNYYCTGCHSNSTQSGGINLVGYSNIQTLSKNGRLYGAISHQVGFKPMPSIDVKLSDCHIGLFKQWIDAGMPNN